MSNFVFLVPAIIFFGVGIFCITCALAPKTEPRKYEIILSKRLTANGQYEAQQLFIVEGEGEYLSPFQDVMISVREMR